MVNSFDFLVFCQLWPIVLGGTTPGVSHFSSTAQKPSVFRSSTCVLQLSPIVAEASVAVAPLSSSAQGLLFKKLQLEGLLASLYASNMLLHPALQPGVFFSL